MTEHDDLYSCLVAYEDASGSVQVQQLTLMSAYRTLTDAIGGHGDLGEAQARFALEFPILAVFHEEWKQAALAVSAAVADGMEWQQSFTVAYPRRCANCGRILGKGEAGTCSDCVSTSIEARDQANDHSLSNPFEDVARQPYGERGVLGTEQL